MPLDVDQFLEKIPQATAGKLIVADPFDENEEEEVHTGSRSRGSTEDSAEGGVLHELKQVRCVSEP